MKLTQGHSPEDAARIAATHPGQAHWAGSGPPGRTCHECIEHWGAPRIWRPQDPDVDGCGPAMVLTPPRPRYDTETRELKGTSCWKRTRLLAPVRPIAVPPLPAGVRLLHREPEPAAATEARATAHRSQPAGSQEQGE
jgi:hypothetical protein